MAFRQKRVHDLNLLAPDASEQEMEKGVEELQVLQKDAAKPVNPMSLSGTPASAPGTKAPARAENLESLGVVSLGQGDIFSIGMLLKAANVSLDMRRHHVPAWVGGSYRSSGFVLVIRIHYSNVEPWLGLKVLPWNFMGPTLHYSYRITKHASHDDFMLRQVHERGQSELKGSREVKEFHGIRILIEQSGSVAVWDNIQLLLILTTTLALTAVAHCITDTVALHFMPESDAYRAIKYERPRAKKATLKQGQRQTTETDAREATDEEQGEPDNVMRYSSVTM